MASIVRVKATGKWRARVRRPGAPAQSKNFLTKVDAEAWARGVEVAVERGLWRPDDASTTTTLAAGIDRYACRLHERLVEKLPPDAVLRVPRGAADVTIAIRELDGKNVGALHRVELLLMLAASPIRGVQILGRPKEASILRILADEDVADLPLSMIHSADIAVLRDRWMKAGLAPSSVQRRMHTLSHIFTVAAREWRMPSLVNPVRAVAMPEADDARDRRVSADELDAICAAGADTRHLADFVRLAVETACRREELLRLRWSDVDLEGRTIRLLRTKNGEARTVPLTRVATALLQGMQRDGKRVFDGWASPDTATQAFERAVVRARTRYLVMCEESHLDADPGFLVDVRLHDLRHEGISRLATRGIEVHQLAKITGHLTLRMLMRYYNPTDKELVALVD